MTKLKHHRITKKEKALEETLDLKKLVHARVLSSKGQVIGKVKELRINQKTLSIEGIVVSRGFMKKPLYIGSSYFEDLSDESLILKIEPSVLLIGKKVLSSEGKVIGEVKDIERQGHTNEILDLIIKKPLRKSFIIKKSYVKYLGDSIILNSNYNGKKKHFWKKPGKNDNQ